MPLYRQLNGVFTLDEVVINTLPKKRTRAELHRLPGYDDLRNHVVDFLIKRAKPGEPH